MEWHKLQCDWMISNILYRTHCCIFPFLLKTNLHNVSKCYPHIHACCFLTFYSVETIFFFYGNELRYENRSSAIFNSKIIFLLFLFPCFLYFNFPVTCISKVLYTTQIVKAAPKGSCHDNPYHLVFQVSSGWFFKMHQYNEPCLNDFSFLKLASFLFDRHHNWWNPKRSCELNLMCSECV